MVPEGFGKILQVFVLPFQFAEQVTKEQEFKSQTDIPSHT